MEKASLSSAKPAAFPSGLRTAPLLLALPYLCMTLVFFLLGPYEFPVREWWVVYFYVPLIFTLLGMAFALASSGNGVGKPMKNAILFFWIGVIGTVLLLIPSALIYTDKWPWQIANALADQRETYATLGEQLQETQGARGPVALTRAVIAPFAFAVLPLTVIYWTVMSPKYKAAGVIVVLVGIDLSILRGTTRELADIVIIGASAFLVSLGRRSILSGSSLFRSLGRHWKLVILGPLLVAVVLVALVGRTEARLGGQNVLCLDRSGACISNSEPYRSMDDASLFGLATITGYLSQGYYGLTLAAEKPFQTTYGVGHSPAVSAIYVIAGGDEQTILRAYTARASADGWSDATQWSTLLTWIANDIGFIGAALCIVFIGLIWGRAWVNATQGLDDFSAILFCALMMMVFYLPANNQMMATYDGYVTLLFWGLATFWGKRQAPSIGQ